MNVESAADTASIAAANSNANWTVSLALRDRQAELRRECRRALCGRDVLLHRAAERAQIGMPHGDAPRCVGRIAEDSHALAVGAGRPGAVGDDDERAHL